MTRHHHLKDEAYVNDTVIHQNACEDRKLKQELRQLDRVQHTQRRRLEHAQSYFTTLHKVVPNFNTTEDMQSMWSPGCGSKTQAKRGLKRNTEPRASICQLMEFDAKTRLAAQRPSEAESDRTRSSSFSDRDKYNDGERNSLLSARLRKSSDVFPRHTNVVENGQNLPISSNAWEKKQRHSSLSVQGTQTRIDDRIQRIMFDNEKPRKTRENNAFSPDRRPSRFARHPQQTITEAVGNDKITNGSEAVGKNGTRRTSRNSTAYNAIQRNGLHNKVKDTALYGCGDEDSDISQASNTSECGGSSDSSDSDTLPQLTSDEIQQQQQQIGLRVSGGRKTSQQLRMLYQIRNGHVDVRENQTPDPLLHREFRKSGERTTVDKLGPNVMGNNNFRRLKNAARSPMVPTPLGGRISARIDNSRADSPMPNAMVTTGLQMTLVKFLPKSKQAFYLKYGERMMNNYSKS
eukprot:gene15016-16566_t